MTPDYTPWMDEPITWTGEAQDNAASRARAFWSCWTSSAAARTPPRWPRRGTRPSGTRSTPGQAARLDRHGAGHGPSRVRTGQAREAVMGLPFDQVVRQQRLCGRCAGSVRAVPGGGHCDLAHW